METANITITAADQGEQLSIAGGNYRFLITGEETENRFAVIEMIVPPGAGPAPHEHPDIQETFYVAEGEVEFRTEASKQVAARGAFINIPLNGMNSIHKSFYFLDGIADEHGNKIIAIADAMANTACNGKNIF